jgi:hypothetical protein
MAYKVAIEPGIGWFKEPDMDTSKMLTAIEHVATAVENLAGLTPSGGAGATMWTSQAKALITQMRADIAEDVAPATEAPPPAEEPPVMNEPEPEPVAEPEPAPEPVAEPAEAPTPQTVYTGGTAA